MKDEMVIVDTSCWIEYFNRPESKEGKVVKTLLEEDRVVIAGVIIAELLQGAREEKEFQTLKESLITLPFLQERPQSWEEVGRLSFEMRKKGLTVPLTDCLIAVLAKEEDYSIFTLDSHFISLPNIKLYRQNVAIE